ncbi:7SK snRNA methylphosphate capping enzyme-like [Acanthaster planci]|uniref:RNA methyltransferase n=1 Tax=Acanthaster planci TaxID=133434 RepID=A0A8B7YD09_ACAPL|nr:7SK snRNA methylphosphate capping enzyme-like [Acanthaster planci]
MSSQAEALPVSTGHPESWNLRPDTVDRSSICEVSEHQNWMAKEASDDQDDIGSCPSGSVPSQASANSKNSEVKLEQACLHELDNQRRLSGSNDDGSAVEVSAKKKRHASVSNPGNHKQVGRKRRKTTDRSASHPKFLMGGSITDPLNLNSLCNEEVSRCLNAATPISSPLPLINKDPNPVLVPIDLSDPLKLNTVCGEVDDVASLTRTLTPKLASKKRKKRMDKITESHSADEATIIKSKPSNLNLEGAKRLQHHGSTSKIVDKIVSPVIPESQIYRKRKKQEPTAKISRALLIERTDSKPKEVSPDKKTPPPKRDRTPEKRRYKRQTSKELPKFKEQNKKFQYGNYHRYYGYRNPDQEDDSRIPFLKRKWFEGKTCLDIGCNSGHLTLYLARNFAPQRITGIDIDATLIGIARKNIRHCLEMDKNPGHQKFPVSMEKTYGPINSTEQPAERRKTTAKFPGNMLFRCANFVPENDDIMEMQKPEYDTVLCLSVTKWVHLNWGDAGLKRMFRRIFLCLRPGGRLILESQAWPSYTKKKKLTETIYRNFKQIQLKPDKFKDYLLSSHVGFSSCETIGTPLNKSKGFRRPILMFTKLTTSRDGIAKPEVPPSPGCSSTTSKMEQLVVPTLHDTPSTGDRTPLAVPHKIGSRPLESSCAKGECAAGSTCQGTSMDPQPDDGKQASRDDKGNSVEVEQSDHLPKRQALSQATTETEEKKLDTKRSFHVDELVEDGKKSGSETPPAKKVKAEVTTD